MLWLPTDEEAVSGLMLQLDECVDQGAVNKRLLDDADPARASRYFDQLGRGSTDKQQHRQVGTFIEKPLYESGSTQPRKVCFHQQAAMTLMNSGPGLQKSFRIRVEMNINTVGVQERRQAITECLVRIYYVNYEFVTLQQSILERDYVLPRVSFEVRPQWYLGYPVNVCGSHDPACQHAVRPPLQVLPLSSHGQVGRGFSRPVFSSPDHDEPRPFAR